MRKIINYIAFLLVLLSSNLLYAEHEKITPSTQVKKTSRFHHFLKSIWGHPPEKSSISIGSLVYHYWHPRRKILYPFVTLRLKNGFSVMAFENTFHHFSMAVGSSRVVYSNVGENTNGKGFSAGYDVGVLYGYCLSWYRCLMTPASWKKNFFNSVPIMPAFDVYAQYAFSRHFGMRFTWAGFAIVKADLLYQF